MGLPVLHVFEPEVRDQVPADVYEAQVALMEMSLDREAILSGLREARKVATTGAEDASSARVMAVTFDASTSFATRTRRRIPGGSWPTTVRARRGLGRWASGVASR